MPSLVGESVHHHVQQRGLTGEEGAVKGAFAVSRPVIFAVLTTMVAFALAVPVGCASQFTRQLSLVITLALLFSLIEAFMILPSHLRDLSVSTSTSKWALRQRRVADKIVQFAEHTYQPFS